MSNARPAQVPENATFDEKEQNWGLGEKDGDDKKTGLWTYWRGDGSKQCEEEWGDGRARLTYRRFHPDGSVAQSGAKDLVKEVWVGPMRWTWFEEESPENQFFPASGTKNARAFELLFEDGWVVAEQLFDGSGARITATGAPFPQVPEGLPDGVLLANGDRLWLAQTRSLDGTRRRGAYTIWDRNGVVHEKHQYADGGGEQPLRREKYDNGALKSVLEHNGADKVQSFYRRRRGAEAGGPPSLKESTIYRGGDDDRETTYYDESGARLFSVRLEEQEGEASFERRYYDGKLVFEALWNKEQPKVPPTKVEYYGAGGEVLVDYVSLGGGKGQWRLHQGGAIETLPLEKESELSKYGNWATFLPGFARYDEKWAKPDWESVTESFLSKLDQHRFAERVAALPIPDALAPVLGRVDWDNTRAAYRGPRLDQLIAMMLGADEVDAERAHGAIWGRVEEQDCVYAASYAVAESLARLLPLVSAEAPRRRALKLLAEIVCLAAMPHEDEERYAEVIAAVREVGAELEAFVRKADDDDSRSVMHLLSVLGLPEVLRARMVDAAASVESRSFAACAFATCKGRTDEQRAEAIGELRKAIGGEADVGVKVILGVLVRLMGGGSASDAAGDAAGAAAEEQAIDAGIDAQLVHYILRPDAQPELFAAWRPVIRYLGDDIPSTLMRVVPARTRKAHMATMLDRLPSRGSLDQAEDLDILFGTLFPQGAEQPLSPLRRRALRIAADLVDANPGFVNHGEIFRKHSLPWDSFKLRELASAGESEGEVEPDEDGE